ncbi:MAG: hypothetical protein ISS77_05995 [Phycisphaerae bacterium]|nr:hypothetical protein [Phycisphaerae bacterium]
MDGPFRAWGTFDGQYWTTKGDYGSYGLNSEVQGVKNTTQTYQGLLGSDFWRHSNVKGADNVPLLLDAVWCGGWPKHTDRPTATWQHVTSPEIQRFVLNRHLGFTNAVFLDLSVHKVGLKALWRLKWHRSFNINYAYDNDLFSGTFVEKLPNKIE